MIQPTTLKTVTLKQKILDYLEQKSCEIPFPEDSTYWHFSGSCCEWYTYARCIDNLAGISGNKVKVLISDDQKEVIKKIHQRLQWHLIIGWLLSAVTRTIKHEKLPGERNRDWVMGTHGAWRSFFHAYDESHYNPFRANIGLGASTLGRDLYDALTPIVEEVEKALSKAMRALYGTDSLDVQESLVTKYEALLDQNMPKVEERLKIAYQVIAQEIRALLQSF